VEIDIRHAGLKTAARDLFQAENLRVHGHGKWHNGRRDAIGRVHAEHDVSARGIGEGRYVGQ
jgi:hypothetical protein